MGNGDPIIIKGGGSVAIEFNESHYTGNDGRYYSKDATIVSVEVVDDDTGGNADRRRPEQREIHDQGQHALNH